MAQYRDGPSQKTKAIIIGICVALWTAIVVIVARGCDTGKDVPPAPIIVAPDGGERAVAIEERLDAAVVAHEAEIQVIERTVIVRRVEFERAQDAEETSVRAQGRDAVALWLESFAASVGTPLDAGPTDYVDPAEGP